MNLYVSRQSLSFLDIRDFVYYGNFCKVQPVPLLIRLQFMPTQLHDLPKKSLGIRSCIYIEIKCTSDNSTRVVINKINCVLSRSTKLSEELCRDMFTILLGIN